MDDPSQLVHGGNRGTVMCKLRYPATDPSLRRAVPVSAEPKNNRRGVGLCILARHSVATEIYSDRRYTRRKMPEDAQGQPRFKSTPADPIVVDVELVYSDDEYDPSEPQSSYTTSLASSVVDYPVEHGRRYHAYRAGTYVRPNDEPEMDRLRLLHEIMTKVIGGLQRAPIQPKKPLRILDIGTGTGEWAVAIGEEFPEASVLGNDLSANMPAFIPANVKFEVDDVESPWTHNAKFDYIFSRYMAASIIDWPKLVNTVYENLNPGGWCEFQDFDLMYYSDDGSLKPDDPLKVWHQTLIDAAASLGRDPNPGSKLEGWVRDAGFDKIVHTKYKIPIGPWAKDPLLKEIGAYNFQQVDGGMEGLSMRLYRNVLKWSEEDIHVLLKKARQSMRNPSVHAMFDFHVVYGQKKMTA